MSDVTAAAIRSAIEDHGPIRFSEFMELALYGPGGFYERPPVGVDEDFVTSPHVHPVFATLVARALDGFREGLGDPRPLRVVEVGAGDGTFARDLIAASGDGAIAYEAVERSAGARERLGSLSIHAREDIGAVGRLDGVVLANELLDNLPFDRVRRRADGTGVEVRVTLGTDRFEEVEVVLDAAAPVAGSAPEAIHPVAATGFIDRLAGVLARGYALLIDYGDEGPSGEVHGYRGHRLVEDVLADPGTTDITAGVDFGLLMDRARERGLDVLGLVTQREALLALGLESWIHDELDRQAELLNSGKGFEAVRRWGGRSRATLLADPSALGRLRWLVLATPGLPTPSWLEDAGGGRPVP